MSRALLSRIERLEARKAKQGPREIGIIVERFPDRWEEDENGVWRRKPYFNEDTYAEFARNQQSRLMTELAEFAKQLDEGEDSDVQAPHVGTVTERAPLPPGHKGKRFVFTMEKGREIEIDTLTGKSRFT